MEKPEIIVNEMMADDDLGNVDTHDAKMTQSDSDTSNEMSYEDVCAIAWKEYNAGKGAGKKGPNGSGTWHRGRGADERTSGRRDDGGKKGVNRTPTHAACTGAHSVSAHHTAQSDHFSSREHAWFKFKGYVCLKQSVIHASCLVPCRT